MQPKLTPKTLLAKSFETGSWQGSYSLVGHTADVVNAVTTLVDVLGNRLIEQFGLKQSLNEVKNTARLTAYLHDWGKANHHFQGVVRAKMKGASPKRYVLNNPQMVRHEALSVLLTWEFREWLQQGKGDFYTALAAAGGHHLKLGGAQGRQNDELGEIRQGDTELFLYTLVKNGNKPQLHRNFKGLLKYGIKALGLPQKLGINPKDIPNCWTKKQIENLQCAIKDFFSDWQEDPAFLAVIKSLLISGDAIASALPPVGKSIPEWIEQEVKRTLDETKLQKVIDAKLAGKKLRNFQVKLGQSQARVTLARAGCGTGKTLGAYNWAKTHALGRKLFFCYPTTGTSTEGFIDYVHDKVDAVLFHSRASVDLKSLMETGEEGEAGELNNEIDLKLASFKAWGREAIVCTVDTVLGWLQCNRKPVYCFPAIAQGAFVFDEVHCYDNHLFGALLRFLEVVKAPVLLMSASFLPWQKEAIAKAVGEPIEIIQGSQKLESQPRYRFHYQEKPSWERVKEELNSEGKVLWVCNQVNTAIRVYEEAKHRNLNAVLYHSRYRYQDRVNHHRAVVDGFKADEPILAITTQVAEMSLDLSATLLVSQVADPAGLIQRLGRLNRHHCVYALGAIFYPDEKVGYPYGKELLAAGLALIESFPTDVSQAELAQWLEQSDTSGEPEKNCVLLDGKWRTYSTSLRQAGYTTTVLLEQDLEQVKSLPKRELPAYTVPILAKGCNQWERYKFYPVAPKDIWGYSEEKGAYELCKNNENRG